MNKLLLTGLFWAATIFAVYAQNQNPDDSLIKARYLVSENRYENALATLENHLLSEDDFNIGALTMGRALSGAGRYEESNDWLQKVTGDEAAEAYYFQALNYLELNNYPLAIQSMSKHLADKNHFSEKDLRLDKAFSKIENDRSWIHLWQTEWYSVTEKQIAECEYLLSQDLPDEAKTLADQLLIDHPDEPRAHFVLAKVYFLQKEGRLFNQSFDHASALAVSRILLDEMLQFAMDNKIYEKANVLASGLIRKDPTNPQYLITRALIRILEAKEAVALRELEMIERAGITPAELYYQAGRKIAVSKPEQAEVYLTRAIETGAMDDRYYFYRGVVRSRLEKAELALDDFAMSLDIYPRQPELLIQRAQIRFDAGDTEGACHDWKKALEMGNAKAADLLYKHCRSID